MSPARGTDQDRAIARTSASTSPARSASSRDAARRTSASRRSFRPRSRSATGSRSGRSSAPRAIAGGVGLGLQRLGAPAPGPIGFREGYLVVSLTWLLAAGYGALPYLLSGDRQLDRPVDAFFEGDVRVHDDRRDGHRGRRGARPLAPHLAAAHPVARRDGDHRARARRPSPAPRRRAPAARVGAARARGATSSPSASATRRAGSGCSTSRSRSCCSALLTVIGLLGLDDRWSRSKRSRTRSRRSRRRLLDRAALARAASRR